MAKPVILLAFANEQEAGGRYLRNLPLELNHLRATLEKAEDQQLCELVILSNATLENLITTFQREKYRNRIAVFHYGGHAGSYELLLESAEGSTAIAHGAGLVSFLASQPSLKLAFLNGCFSSRQAQALTEGGIPAVIGTVKAIDDKVATSLAASFYKALGEGSPLDKAWQEATYKIKAQEGDQDLSRYYAPTEASRSISFRETHSQFPWEIYYRPGAEAIRDWNLPEAADDPYFGLPDVPEGYRFPESPYRFLERYKKEDARIFFGRGKYIRDLYHRIDSPQAAPAILLYGQSGVGKSSLLEAGLFPRLETAYDIRAFRRQPETGLLGQLAEALELPPKTTEASTMLRQWKQLEAASGKKGIVIVLDQVEEVFTRPAQNLPEELADFLATASNIFAQPADKPAGKLLLSYRKEYDPEIEKACRAAGLPKEKVFLERLDRKGVLEIVGGLGADQQLKNKYRLEIEEGLPVLIADDLLEDRNSPIAPVLQITLTKLWQQQEEQGHRAFRTEDYQQLKKEGILLDDFFHQQMAQIKAWEEQVEQAVASSGLALDVLHYHTTPLGTAEGRSLENLRIHYQHQSEVLQHLLEQLQALYLLAGLGPEQTALAHDTLAPIVQKEIRDSDKPGQRALRILNAKMADYAISPERTYIDEEDLALVEAGAGGMRMWTSKERALVEKSRGRKMKLVAERRRNRRLKITGVIAIALLAAVATVLGWRSKVQATANEWVAQAYQLENTDATLAMEKVQQAWQVINGSFLPIDDEMARQARYQIYQNNEFYLRPFLHEEAVVDISYSDAKGRLLSASGRSAYLWDTAGQKLDSFPHTSRVNAVAFSADGTQALTASDDRLVRLWETSKAAPLTFSGLPSVARKAVFSPDGRYVLAGSERGELILWDRQGQLVVPAWPAHRDSITGLAFAPDGNTFISTSWDGEAFLWNLKGEKIRPFSDTNARILGAAFSPDGQLLATACRDKVARLQQLDGTPATELKGHRQRVNSVAFLSDGQELYLLTAGMDGQVKLWDTLGNVLTTYKGHDNSVNALAVSADGQHFASAGDDRTIKWWKTDSKVIRRFEHPSGVADAAFFPDDNTILTGAGSGMQAALDLSNDLIFEEYDEGAADAIPEPGLLEQLLMETENPQPAILWSTTGRLLQLYEDHQGPISSVAVSGDGSVFLTSSEDGVSRIRDRKNEELLSITDPAPPLYSSAISADGKTIATSNGAYSVLLWNRQGEQLAMLPHPELVSSLAFSPDGNTLLTGCFDGIARLWTVKDGSLAAKHHFPDELASIDAVAFSPDGTNLAIAGEGPAASALLLLRKDGALLFVKHIGGTTKTGAWSALSVAFSPDGELVVAGTVDGRIEALDRSGRQIFGFYEKSRLSINSIAFSPDGKYFLAGSEDKWARLYPNIANPSSYENE